MNWTPTIHWIPTSGPLPSDASTTNEQVKIENFGAQMGWLQKERLIEHINALGWVNLRCLECLRLTYGLKGAPEISHSFAMSRDRHSQTTTKLYIPLVPTEAEIISFEDLESLAKWKRSRGRQEVIDATLRSLRTSFSVKFIILRAFTSMAHSWCLTRIQKK